MKRTSIIIGIVVIVVIAAVLVYFFAIPPKIERNIKVGVIDCYTGPAAMFSNEALDGFKLALNEINKEGSRWCPSYPLDPPDRVS